MNSLSLSLSLAPFTVASTAQTAGNSCKSCPAMASKRTQADSVGQSRPSLLSHDAESHSHVMHDRNRLTQMYLQPLDQAGLPPNAPAELLPRPPTPPTPPSSRSGPPTRTTRTKAGTPTGATRSTATRLPPTMLQTMTSMPTPSPKKTATPRTRTTSSGQRSGPQQQRTRPRAKGKGKPRYRQRARARGKQELHPQPTTPTPPRESGSLSVAAAAATRLPPQHRPRRPRHSESQMLHQRRAVPYQESTSDKTATTATSRCDPTKPRGRSTLSRPLVTSSSKTFTRSPSTRPTSSSRSPNRSHGRSTSTSTS